MDNLLKGCEEMVSFQQSIFAPYNQPRALEVASFH
jgi:hypothetical protein